MSSFQVAVASDCIPQKKTTAKDLTLFPSPKAFLGVGNERVGPDSDAVRGRGERNVRRGVNCFGSLVGKHINIRSNGG